MGNFDELLVQFHRSQPPVLVLQDAGGDVVAGAAPYIEGIVRYRVAVQYGYDAYGELFFAEHFHPHARLFAGHKGLFFDRLDAPIVDAQGDDSPRLVPYAHGHYHNRNRVYSPALQRFMQRDPNATALALLTIAARHGQGAFGGLDEFDLEAMYGDGLNLYTYLGSNPWGRHDPLGLQWDPFDMVDDFLAESLGQRMATLSAIGQDSKAAAVVLATIASYLPFPAASIMGEAALRALGESTDSEMAMAMALAAVPGGKLAAVLGRATSTMWRGAMHYARIGGGAILNRGSGLMRKAKDFLRRKPPSACGCFIAGTLVWTAHGMVPIEEVRVGDFVIAKDEASGALVLREVTDEIVVKQAALLDVALQRSDHETTLRTTDEHPFWVTGRGWTRADSLVPGDEVETFGSTATVLALSFTGDRTTVYNISVDGNPNYFVGPDGVWVHNCPVGGDSTAVLAYIRANGGRAPQGFRGGGRFHNDGRNGGQVLPQTDASGRPVTYAAYDIWPSPKNGGPPRTAERIVMGSDGRAWFTADHYATFTLMP